MVNPFIGQITIFAGNFPPRAYAFCDGQLMSISQNTALFSILGTTYGGDGRTTFGLPDLRGRVAVNPRRGPGLSTYQLGQRGGLEEVYLNVLQIPSHNHLTQVTEGSAALPVNGTAGAEDSANPVGHVLANYGTDSYTSEAATGNYGSLAPVVGEAVSLTNTGGSQSHENRRPYLAINYIISLFGTYPSRS